MLHSCYKKKKQEILKCCNACWEKAYSENLQGIIFLPKKNEGYGANDCDAGVERDVARVVFSLDSMWFPCGSHMVAMWFTSWSPNGSCLNYNKNEIFCLFQKQLSKNRTFLSLIKVKKSHFSLREVYEVTSQKVEVRDIREKGSLASK